MRVDPQLTDRDGSPVVDQAVGADRLPALEGQQGQQGPLFGPAHRHRHARLHCLELAEQPHLHKPNRTSFSRRRPRRVTAKAPCSQAGLPQRHISLTSGPQRRLPAETKQIEEGKSK